MQTIFILRRFTLNATAADPDFKALRSMLSDLGYRVLPVPITWNRQTLTSYVEGLAQFYDENKSEHNTLLGGSFGAMASFIAGPRLKPDRLILCSLSALFREDLPSYQDQYLANWLGQRRVADLKNHSASTIATQILESNVKTSMVFGDKEKAMHPKLYARVKETAAALQITPIELPGAGHKMRDPKYVAGLQRVMAKLAEN